jgi:hypothetical protein
MRFFVLSLIDYLKTPSEASPPLGHRILDMLDAILGTRMTSRRAMDPVAPDPKKADDAVPMARPPSQRSDARSMNGGDARVS